MKQSFVHSLSFRIFGPPLHGLLMYLLVLLIFDNIDQLTVHYFSQEAILCIGLSWVLSETLRWATFLWEKRMPEQGLKRRQTFLLLLIHMACSITIISAGIAAYFYWVIGYSSFSTELITLNSLYLVTTIMYSLLHTGIYYMQQHNLARLEAEEELKQKMEQQLSKLQQSIEPELLTYSLETLLQLIYTNREAAEDYIDNLATHYRYTLNQQQQELSSLREELQATHNLLKLYAINHPGTHLEVVLPQAVLESKLPAGTLPAIAKHILQRALPSPKHPTLLTLKQNNKGMLELQCQVYERLDLPTSEEALIAIQHTYIYYTDQPFSWQLKKGGLHFTLPLLHMQEDAVVASVPAVTTLNVLRTCFDS
jgi:two-component system, LytTR family, sensor kinase